ncbi:uncharacterized protein LOC127113288 [Lathyrus oleraceus]|uniref:uncharacterized protein LOC127113288 n=1 Tax=Pisum sativum TaxID=3888 RepID=UPI0021D2631D|nr:uncharacterized protein LOC127113288 [Pisum sativum]
MAAPVAIGTRGTIGSLVRKEIEYFTKFELDRRGISQKPQQHFVDMEMVSDRTISMSKPSFWFLPTTWKRKKQRNTTSRIPGFSYKILRNDINNFHL